MRKIVFLITLMISMVSYGQEDKNHFFCKIDTLNNYIVYHKNGSGVIYKSTKVDSTKVITIKSGEFSEEILAKCNDDIMLPAGWYFIDGKRKHISEYGGTYTLDNGARITGYKMENDIKLNKKTYWRK